MANRRSCTGIFVAMVLVAVAVAWDEVPKQSHSVSLAQGASTDVDVVGVDAILDHVKATLVAKTPAAESPLNSALSTLKLQYIGFKKAFDAVDFDLKETASGTSDALTGTDPSGLAMVATADFNPNQGAAWLLGYGLDTVSFGKFVKQSLGSDPFSSMPLLSNIQAAGWVAEVPNEGSAAGTIVLPAAVKATLPATLSQVPQFEKGLCFRGKVGAPTAGCAADPVCTLAKSAIGSTGLHLHGCLNVQETSDLGITMKTVSLSNTVKIEEAELKYSFSATDRETTFGAAAKVDAKIGEEWVKFTGEMYLSQQSALTLLGIKAGMTGVLPNAFGQAKLTLHDLVFEAEVGVAAALPVIDRLIIGGGLCLGDTKKCAAMASAKIDTTATLVQEFAEEDSPLALRTYIGFDVSSGDAFFYAALADTSIGRLVTAFAGQSVDIPVWLAKVQIGGYDTAACTACGGTCTACFAYIAMATKKQTIETLTPPLVIPSGLTTQGRMTVLGAEVGFGLTMNSTFFKLELDAPVLSLGDGKVKVQRRKTDATKGPAIKMKADFTEKDFALHMTGFCKVAGLGEAEVTIAIDNEWQIFRINEMSLFGGTIRGEALLMANIADPAKMVLNGTINIAQATAPLAALTASAVKPIQDLEAKIQKLIDQANAGIDRAEVAVEDASKKCDNAEKAVDDQKAKCEFLEEQMMLVDTTDSNNLMTSPMMENRLLKTPQLGEDDWLETGVQLFGRRRRRWFNAAADLANKAAAATKEAGNKATAAANEAAAKTAAAAAKTAAELKDKAAAKAKEVGEKAVQEVKSKATEVKNKAAAKANELAGKAADQAKGLATEACKGALDGATAAMDGACDAGVDAASAGLDKAQAAVDKLAKSAKEVLQVAKDAIETLSNFQIQGIEFGASGLESKVSIGITILLNAKIKEYQLEYNLEGSSAAAMAKESFNKIFKQLKEAAQKQIQDWLASSVKLLQENNLVEEGFEF